MFELCQIVNVINFKKIWTLHKNCPWQDRRGLGEKNWDWTQIFKNVLQLKLIKENHEVDENPQFINAHLEPLFHEKQWNSCNY